MNLQNGYKVIYEKTADGKRTFYASKTGFFKDAELITEAVIGEYKLIYEKDGNFYGSASGIPSEDDYCFEDFKKVFEKASTDSDSGESVTPDEPAEVPTEEPEEEPTDVVEDKSENELEDESGTEEQ